MTGKQARLDLETARRAADAAIAAAREGGNRVSVAVVDTRGHDLLVVRDDAPRWFTAGVARGQGRHLRADRHPHHRLSGLADAHPALADLIDSQAAQSLTTCPVACPSSWTVTWSVASAVSGAQPDEDVSYAKAGLAAG
ncbi:heme-binding protein [Rhodococcus hoagii]|nr:heme-binding protein [Prescottella equi]